MHGGNIYQNEIEYDFSVNLNPYGKVESLNDFLRNSIDKVCAYPDMQQSQFRRAISRIDCVAEEMVIGGNGASELIMAVVRNVNPKKVLLPTPCFSGYAFALNSIGEVEVVDYGLKVEDSFVIKEDFLDYINPDIDMLILANPNNPTGQRIPDELLIKILDRCHETNTVILMDECFLKLTKDPFSLKRYTVQYKELYILDAFTKLFSIPGIRLGYLVSCPENIIAVRKQLPEWNMSVLAQEAGVFCADVIMNTDYIERSLELIESQREYLAREFTKLGIKVFDSDTNFLLVKTDMNLYQYLLDRKILIRECEDYASLGKDYYRVAVKLKEECEFLVKNLQAM